MTNLSRKGEKLTGTPKMLVELGPLAAFFIGYFMGGRIGPVLDRTFGTQMFSEGGDGVFVATALFIPVWLVASIYSVWKERSISPMLILTGVLVIGFGSLTLIFQSKIFYYVKSTLIYLLFAGLLGGGLIINRIFLKMIMGEALNLPDSAWRTLTWRFTWLYLALALGNEILWRTMTPECLPDAPCAGEAWYVRIETFGFMALIFLFILAQTPFISKHLIEDDDEKAPATNSDTSHLKEGESTSHLRETPDEKSPKDRQQGS